MEALIVVALIIVFLFDLSESAKKKALGKERERQNREQEIKTQMQSKYSETYHPPDWETRRLYVLKRDGHRCTRCGRTESLHVHHIIHRSEKIDHSESNLITLCFSCHGSEHKQQFLDNESLRERSRRKRLIEKAMRGRRIKAKKLFRCEACSELSAAGSFYAKVKTKNLVKRGGRVFYLEEKVCERCLLGEESPR